MAAEKDQKNPEAQSGLIVPLLLLVVLGAAAGFGYGLLFGGATQPPDAVKEAQAHGAGEKSAPPERNGKVQADWRNEQLVPLQPLIVSMNGGKGKWVRIEGAVAFLRESKQDHSATIAQLGQDLMLFLGSAELQQIASPAGLEFLRDDMNDIVQTRTNGQASRFVLKALVIE